MRFGATAVKVVVTVLKKGGSYKLAAKAAGGRPQVLQDWLERGRAGSPRYAGFARACDLAIANYDLKKIGQISKSGELDWRAAAWELERRRPDEYGTEKKLIQEMTRTIDVLQEAVKQLVTLVPPEVLEKAGLQNLRLIGQAPVDSAAPGYSQSGQSPMLPLPVGR